MKKSILILATAFTFSAFFTSCRETSNRTDDVEVTDDVNDDLDDAGDGLERTVDDVESTIDEGANEVETEIERNDDL